MRGTARALVVVLVGAFVACCEALPQGSAGRASTSAEVSRRAVDSQTADRVTDLEALRDGLASRHADPFFRVSRGEFFASVEALKARAGELDESAWLVELHKLVATIGDAHTRLAIVAGKPPCQTSIPIRFVGLADGFFVEAAPTGHLGLLGARLVAVEGVPVEDIARRMHGFMPSETDTAAREVAAVYLKYDRVLHALGVIHTPGRVTYTVVGGAGGQGDATRDDTLNAIVDQSPWGGEVAPNPSKVKLPVGRVTRKEPYWHQFLGEPRVLYCRYDHCADAPEKSVSAWTREVMAEVVATSPRAVVIDLRHNPGGNSGLLLSLVAKLREWKNEAGEEKGNTTPARGVYALIGPATFSSGVTNALNLKEFAGAVLVGEEPGQAIGSFGEVRRFTLPKSGLEVSYGSTIRDDPKNPVPILPDIAAPMTSVEFFAGRDPAMEAVISAR